MHQKSIVNSSLFSDLEKKIEKAELISFDFFDTLFIRVLLDPEDLFDILGIRYDINNFRELRKDAQTEAFRRMHQVGRKEITLEEIYRCFHSIRIPSDELMQTEIELELSFVYPNTEIIDVFKKAIISGKQVVITSDTYLPVCFFREILHTHHFDDVPLFISADCNATKRDFGELFEILARKMDVLPEKILHIGDNFRSDIVQAQAKGLTTYHYSEQRAPPKLSHYSPESSLARGLMRIHKDNIAQASTQELGFLYGGPAAVGFVDWIMDRAERDNIDHILFLARDGYILEQIARKRAHKGNYLIPNFHYFFGSRVVFSLAAMNAENFIRYLPFLLSGSDKLSTSEFFERIGVQSPSDEVINDILNDAKIFRSKDLTDLQKKILYASRWEILKVARKNHRALFLYLKSMNIKDGDRIAFVDIGWSGTSQNAFEEAIKGMFDVSILGYYFCLADTPDRIEFQKKRNMTALISSEHFSKDLISKIYDNRVGIELFFSAPHHTVQGLDITQDKNITIIEDVRNPDAASLLQFNQEIGDGILTFSSSYEGMRDRVQLSTSPHELVMPLLEFITSDNWCSHKKIAGLQNFDNWSFTYNNLVDLNSYNKEIQKR